MVGDVGIGTTSPSARLDVVGNTEINGNLVVHGATDMALDLDSGSIYTKGLLFIHEKGNRNSALGRDALLNVTNGT